MVDLDVLEARAASALTQVGHVRSLQAELPPAGVSEDDVKWNALLMHLLQAIQACIDLALHTVAHESLGIPDGPAGAFALLAERGVVPRALAVQMAGAAGLRKGDRAPLW